MTDTGGAVSRDFGVRLPLPRSADVSRRRNGDVSVQRRAWGNSRKVSSKAPAFSVLLIILVVSGGEGLADPHPPLLPKESPLPKFVDLSAPSQIVNGLSGSDPVTDPPTAESRLYDAIMVRIGLPYRLGGTDDLGYDCSGFIWRVFQEAGIDIPRNSVRELWERLPEAAEGEERTFGVIVFFSGLTHAGIVRDAHSFYHASSSQGIVRSFFSDYWGARVTGYRRVPLSRTGATRPRWSRPRRAVTTPARPSSPRRSPADR